MEQKKDDLSKRCADSGYKIRDLGKELEKFKKKVADNLRQVRKGEKQ